MNSTNTTIKHISQEQIFTGKSPELADIFNLHSCKLNSLSTWQKKIIQAIADCRTSKLGGHLLECDNCGHQEIFYNSCRNRHCPKCQSLAKARWIENRKNDLIPVQYFHIVFTFSDVLYPLALYNKKIVYNILFKAVSETLKDVALNPKNLGAQIGFISVLHTWDQVLNHHPHVHCVVPGGGLSTDHAKWINAPANYFLPVKILSIVFRAKFLEYLEKAFHSKKLTFIGKISYLSDFNEFKNLLRESCKYNWVVYSKQPFGGPEKVLHYLQQFPVTIILS